MIVLLPIDSRLGKKKKAKVHENLPKIKDKQNVLKTSRNKCKPLQSEIIIIITSNFILETVKTKR